MIIIKIALVLCVAEIYQVAIKALINWLDEDNCKLYKELIKSKSRDDTEGKVELEKKIKKDHVRHLTASFAVSGFLAYKTVWFLW